MNREALLKDAVAAKNRARVETQLEHLDEAEDILTRLIDSVQSFLEEDEVLLLDENRSADPLYSSTLSRSLVAHLADAYGMLGGIRWRHGNLTGALHSYEQGRHYEQDRRYAIEDSYNLTNSLVLQILIAPDMLSVKHEEIDKAYDAVLHQAAGNRRRQWWAWADCALLAVLAGRPEEALGAYAQFRNCNPRGSDYRSVLRVLDACLDIVGTVNRPIAELLDRVITGLRFDLGHLDELDGPRPAPTVPGRTT
ncbi:hypothetical protein [Frankia sp. Cas3]|uniref:hypothetical protein n=1 Tax=Frankia sp. Cas3 TaxID=3073926 RepID=UPI002AD22E0E|nr:hypothetical protein [Frankia sp. Cas3]